MSDSAHHSPGSDTHSDEHEPHQSDISAPTSVSEGLAGTQAAQAHLREKKRRRPALACEQCRKRKVRCDRAKPCGPCIKARITSCSYAPTHVPATRGKKTTVPGPVPVSADAADPSVLNVRKYELRPAAPVSGERDLIQGQWQGHWGPSFPSDTRSSNPTSVDGSLSNTGSANRDVDWLIQKVQSLQEKLDNVTNERAKEQGKDHVPARGPGRPGQAMLQHQEKGTIVKTRYYGCGHWVHSAFLFPMELGLLCQAEKTQDELYWNLTKCKEYARTIKDSRIQPLLSTAIGCSIPSRDLADPLIEAYIRTFEGPMRILHIPSFRGEYERFWQSPGSASMPFKMQLQLCLAIGAALHDDTFTLRQTAMQWVYEAQLWLMLPPEKDRITYMGMQIACLVCLARTVCSVGPDLTWLAGGGLLRMAVYMGLHRDPGQLGTMSVYRAELRRRLWATVMELDAQFALDAGASSAMATVDHDTLPPANLNDDQLTDEPDKDCRPPSGPEGPTQTSVQIAMQKSIALRQTVLRHVNGMLHDKSYDSTLAINSRLSRECVLLSKTLSELKTTSEKASPTGVGIINSFHVSTAELALYRCFQTLHQPIILQNLEDPRFYFSRKMFIDSSLKIGQVCKLRGRDETADPGPPNISDIDFKRFLWNGAGMIRNVVLQSVMGVGLYIKQVKGDQSMSMGFLSAGFEEALCGRELRKYLERVMELCRRRVMSGETGIKMLCFVGAALTRQEKTEAGAELSAIHEAIIESATKASRDALELLRGRARLEGSPLPQEGTASTGAPGAEAATVPGLEGASLNPTIFGSLQAFGGGNAMADGMDWMADWDWEGVPDYGWPMAGPQTWNQGVVPDAQLDLSGTVSM